MKEAHNESMQQPIGRKRSLPLADFYVMEE